MKNVTLKDVARAAGVSYSTVSRSLSGSPQIGRETRERILRLCDEMVELTKEYLLFVIINTVSMAASKYLANKARWNAYSK